MKLNFVFNINLLCLFLSSVGLWWKSICPCCWRGPPHLPGGRGCWVNYWDHPQFTSRASGQCSRGLDTSETTVIGRENSKLTLQMLLKNSSCNPPYHLLCNQVLEVLLTRAPLLSLSLSSALTLLLHCCTDLHCWQQFTWKSTLLGADSFFPYLCCVLSCLVLLSSSIPKDKLN